MTAAQIDTVARACHEANRAWCLALGDCSQKSYDDADEWQRESARRGVGIAIGGAGPAEQHEAWCADKRADGWIYGDVKDPGMKRHPCLVPYTDLPVEQKVKDGIYIATVRAFAAAFGSMEAAHAHA